MESGILHVVNMAITLIALTITPLFTALISKTKSITLPKTVINYTVVIISIIYGVTAIVLLAMLLTSLARTWQDTFLKKGREPIKRIMQPME